MIRVEEKTSIKKQNRNDLAKHYTISVMKKRNGYEARITLEIIGGGKNPRLSAFSTNSQLDAVIKLFEKVKERLLEYKIIGHTRGDGRLKTPESYRTIPLNDRLKRRLLEHKEKQQQLFKTYKKKWNKKEYMFLNQYRKPFVPENLSDNMRKFIKKYELEHMTPYGLRHSFASFCLEKGMDLLVLMKLMGHSDFNTTQKYYISISNKRKKLAMEKAYKSILEKENAI